MKNEALKVVGSMTAVLTSPNGEVKTVKRNNLIVDVGYDFIADSIASPTRSGPLSNIAVGSGTAPAAPADISLQTEEERKTSTYVHGLGTRTFTLSTLFTQNEAIAAITEAGIFNAPSGGVMIDRVVFPVINKALDDLLEVTFTFTMSS